MYIFLQQTPVADQPREFDVSILWRTFIDLAASLLARLPYIIVGIIVFIVFIIFARIAKNILRSMSERTRMDVMLAYLLSRLASGVLTIIGFFAAATVVFPTLTPGSLVAGLGITSVAIGFAFKDILQNFFAGILILWRRPFRVGDQIRTNGYEGTVEEINIRSTRIKTYDGERAVLPNGDVYMSAILVRTAYKMRRVQFTVGIGYPDSIDKARTVIHRVLSETEGVLDDPSPWVYVTELALSSVNFNVYFWVESEQANVLAVSDRVATGIKLALDKAGIDIPYNHTVVLFHDVTGTREGDISMSSRLALAGQSQNGQADARKGKA